MGESSRPRTAVFVISMLAAIAASVALTPKPLYTDKSPPPLRLEQAIPTRFGDWQIDPNGAIVIVSPDVQAMLDKLYSDTLSRTYVNSHGDRIMLSLAYGADQSRSLQVHRPEICYGPQGFALSTPVKAYVDTGRGRLQVTRIRAIKGDRNEPLTYWIRSGDDIVGSWLEQNISRVKAGLAGHYPDGILVRVSLIDPDTSHAYTVESAFIRDLIGALTPAGQTLLLGKTFLATPSSSS